jgi:hypothetical protein
VKLARGRPVERRRDRAYESIVSGVLRGVARQSQQHPPFDVRSVAVDEDRQGAPGGRVIARAGGFA